MNYVQVATGRWGRIAILVLAVNGLLLASVGFGLMRKKEVSLKVRQPALVRLANTSVAFMAGSSNKEYAQVVQSLIATLQTELVSDEKTLVVKQSPKEADWTLTMVVTGYSVSPPQKEIEGSGNTQVAYLHWNGSLNAAYQVTDQNGRVHDAQNVSDVYNQRFQEGATAPPGRFSFGVNPFGPKKAKNNEPVPANEESVKQILIQRVVQKIAAKLGNTTQTIGVQVASGEEHLDRAAQFMDNDLWARALDEIEKGQALPKPEDEAYRQYDLGLIYEAMSYEGKSANDQRENIFKASEYYDKALAMNPKEKYFVPTVARTRDALARYKTLDAMLIEDKKAQEEAKKSNEKQKLAAKKVTLTDVIDMYTASVGEDQIIEFIQGAPEVEFDPRDKTTMITIAKTKLPLSIQNELRKKVGAPLLHTPPGAQPAAVRKTQ